MCKAICGIISRERKCYRHRTNYITYVDSTKTIHPEATTFIDKQKTIQKDATDPYVVTKTNNHEKDATNSYAELADDETILNQPDTGEAKPSQTEPFKMQTLHMCTICGILSNDKRCNSHKNYNDLKRKLVVKKLVSEDENNPKIQLIQGRGIGPNR